MRCKETTLKPLIEIVWPILHFGRDVRKNPVGRTRVMLANSAKYSLGNVGNRGTGANVARIREMQRANATHQTVRILK